MVYESASQLGTSADLHGAQLISAGFTELSAISYWVSQALAGLGWPWMGSSLFHVTCHLPTGWFALVHRWWQGHKRKGILVQGLL